MSPEDKELAHSLADGGKAIIIGDQVSYPPLQVGDHPIHFDAYQVRFLAALTEYNGNLEKACNAVQKSLEWATNFINSRKFKKFRRMKLALAGARNGDLADWWWKMGIDGAKGYRVSYAGMCELCHQETNLSEEEYSMLQADDLTVKAQCEICQQPIKLERHEEPFKPSREQVQFWDGLGNRLVPKVERVQHEFSDERFSFVSDNNDGK